MGESGAQASFSKIKVASGAFPSGIEGDNALGLVVQIDI